MIDETGPFWAYVLRNPAGRFYIGSTDDLKRRAVEHNDPAGPGSKFAPKHGPWTIVWVESHPTRGSAMARERQIKGMKSARWIRDTLLTMVERVPTRRD